MAKIQNTPFGSTLSSLVQSDIQVNYKDFTPGRNPSTIDWLKLEDFLKDYLYVPSVVPEKKELTEKQLISNFKKEIRKIQ